MKSFLKKILPFFDFIFLPIIYLSALSMKFYRKSGSKRLPRSTKILKKIGVFPIIDHYYEPLFNDKNLFNLKNERALPGVDLNEDFQLNFLKNLNFQDEFKNFIENEKKNELFSFKFNNGSFESGDAEFLFNFIRYQKPRNVIEIGCGQSTKIIQKALFLNDSSQIQTSKSNFYCIEPFEQPWLEKHPQIKLLREKVENVDLNFFKSLESGDLLFIDSSHIIRPQGDVLYEYLNIIPSLKKGVYVHIHDIFTPRDYLETWVRDDVKFWNEQYILEALLTGNSNIEVIASLNMLKNNHFKELKKVCPFLTKSREPGSFYLKVR